MTNKNDDITNNANNPCCASPTRSSAPTRSQKCLGRGQMGSCYYGAINRIIAESLLMFYSKKSIFTAMGQ